MVVYGSFKINVQTKKNVTENHVWLADVASVYGGPNAVVVNAPTVEVREATCRRRMETRTKIGACISRSVAR